MIAVTQLLGMGNIPSDRKSASRWLNRIGVPIHVTEADKRRTELVELSDLPERERIAYLQRELKAFDLQPGEYEADVHRVYMSAPPKARSEAERRAASVRIFKRLGSDVNWADKIAIIAAEAGGKAPSKATINRYLKAVEGIAPINFAPALLPSHGGGKQRSEASESAWSAFMTIIRDAGPEFPLKQAWRDVRDIATQSGWDWPSYPTVYRRWTELPELQRHTARFGTKSAQKRFTQPVHRDKTSLLPMQEVSMDGRTQDFFVDMGDGRPVRPTMLILTDIATNKILGWRLTINENAVDTVQMIRDTCARFGIFDRLNTDNGSAFAGHLVAGGVQHKFRKKAVGIQSLGVCFHLGIDLKFHKPGNPQAKLAERTFAALSRVIDDRPEMKGTHAGHTVAGKLVASGPPLSRDSAIDLIEREIGRHNAETGRRSQGAKMRSYDRHFADGLKDRIPRVLTPRQHYLAGLIYTAVAVDRVGQVRVDNAIYGGPDTQSALLEHHGNGLRVLLGRNPCDLNAPALAFDQHGTLICEDIACIRRSEYNSKEGIRAAERHRKHAAKAARQAEESNSYLSDKEFENALGKLAKIENEKAVSASSSKVVKPHFSSPVQTGLRSQKPTPTEEMLKNFDLENARRLTRG